ncbi:MAG: permease, partial [Candidatus Ratteibacteria bacterium]
MEIFAGIIKEIWNLFMAMSVYLVFGFLVAGLVSVFLKPEKVFKHLGNKRFSSILKAVLLGVPLPLCSCGVIPPAAGLYKSGASKGATLAFLISTPT